MNKRTIVVQAIVVAAMSLAVEGQAGAATLVPAGAVWKYLDDGSDQGTAWRGPSFNDSEWKQGPAQLGYGGNGEVTEVGYIDTDSDAEGVQKNATTYFRHSFKVEDASKIGSLKLRLIRDDGAVVYLNGVKIARSNMPDGDINYTTRASEVVGGNAETAWWDFDVDPAGLVNGTNVLAVEIHQINDTSSDLGMNLELAEAGQMPTERTAAVSQAEGPAVVPAGAVWKYLDDGSDQGAAWRTPSFDDGDWKQGPAQLGFGDNGEVTEVGYIDTDPDTEGVQKNMTTYFRHSFNVADASKIGALKLKLVRDDGAVVYLNGAEIARSNMPDGDIDYTTTSSEVVGGNDESTWWQSDVDAAALVNGRNVLAVEIHQANNRSSDLSMNLALAAAGAGPAPTKKADTTGPVPTKKADIIAPGAELKKLAGGFEFTEGPAADAEGNVFFTDQPNNKIHKWSIDGELSTFHDSPGRANGLYFDKKGNLLACADLNNELWSIDPSGKVTILVKDHKGKKLNGPNDLWIHPKGGIYFTDPFYKRPYWDRGPMEQDGQHVYYLAPDRKQLIRGTDDLVQPNGIIGTPDGKLLYVADIGDRKTYVYRINEDGTLSNKKLFCSMGSDGMTIDNQGNIYLTGKGVTVFNSAGEKIEQIDVPAGWTANVCFGGEDRDTLFITAQKSLYSIQMKVKGVQ
jgi:gluconolactonase